MINRAVFCMLISVFIVQGFIQASSVRVHAETTDVILATTTSTQDTGLLDELLPVFQKKTGFRIKTIAVGSGQAMAMGKKGEADVLLVHSPEDELKFMKEGYGKTRRLVMHNNFIISGPPEDPAGIAKSANAAGAFKRIAGSGSLFISRGDNSGTHAREKALWKKCGINPEGGKWYQQTGLGMGQTLSVAAEKKGYCLTDMATFLSMKDRLGVKAFMEGDGSLLNIYHVIELDSSRFPKINSRGGKSFADFIVSPAAQKIINNFGRARFGHPLYYPDAGKTEKSIGR
ncbi:MAG: substrate-binding domain-containing protein [Spirochaetes bacterium]|jgi:tungstate transport system substrate-binding protein|nr:substrate-binding domain-containing protein [Spirochaetota bacterium]